LSFRQGLNIFYEVTISPEKNILQRKKHCAIFICAHFMWGFWLGLRLSWGFRVRVGFRIRVGVRIR